jgi:PST family polysaccharide transporter
VVFYFSLLHFGTKKYLEIIINISLFSKVLALALPWYVISIFNSVLNGLGSFKRVIWTNSIGNAIGLLFSIVLILSIEPSEYY